MKIIEQEPTNISELKEKANTKDNWKVRLEAVNELAQYDSQKSRHILTELVKNDRVFAVKEAAFKAAQAMGITEKGQPLELKRKGLGYSGKTYTKIFSRVKNETEMEEQMDSLKSRLAHYEKMEASGIMIPVLSVECDYRSPARFGETICIIPFVTCLGRNYRLCSRGALLLPLQRHYLQG